MNNETFPYISEHGGIVTALKKNRLDEILDLTANCSLLDMFFRLSCKKSRRFYDSPELHTWHRVPSRLLPFTESIETFIYRLFFSSFFLAVREKLPTFFRISGRGEEKLGRRGIGFPTSQGRAGDQGVRNRVPGEKQSYDEAGATKAQQAPA